MDSLGIAQRVLGLRSVILVATTCHAATAVVGWADEPKPATPMTHYESSKPNTQPPEPSTPAQPAASTNPPAQADTSANPPAQADTSANAQEFSARSVFSNICGFCHEDGGRKQGKGPKLMGTDKTDEQIFNRIKFGKPGRMAAFGGAFTDDQIRQIVAYIRNLKPR